MYILFYFFFCFLAVFFCMYIFSYPLSINKRSYPFLYMHNSNTECSWVVFIDAYNDIRTDKVMLHRALYINSINNIVYTFSFYIYIDKSCLSGMPYSIIIETFVAHLIAPFILLLMVGKYKSCHSRRDQQWIWNLEWLFDMFFWLLHWTRCIDNETSIFLHTTYSIDNLNELCTKIDGCVLIVQCKPTNNSRY